MDLLEELDQIEHPPDATRVHALMPCMSLACGLDVLKTREPYTLGTHGLFGAHNWPATTSHEPTCPDCLGAHGDLEGLRAEVLRQQGRQAHGRS